MIDWLCALALHVTISLKHSCHDMNLKWPAMNHSQECLFIIYTHTCPHSVISGLNCCIILWWCAIQRDCATINGHPAFVSSRYSIWPYYGFYKKLGIPGPKPLPFLGTLSYGFKKVIKSFSPSQCQCSLWVCQCCNQIPDWWKYLTPEVTKCMLGSSVNCRLT